MNLSSNKTIIALITVITGLIIIGATIVVAGLAKGKHAPVVEAATQKPIEEQLSEVQAIEPLETEEEVSIEDYPEEDLEEANLDNQEAKKDNKPKSENKTNNNTSSPAPSNNGTPYYVKVNYTANVVNVYGLDGDGNYTVPVRAMVCSTGSATPRSGRYKAGYKARWIALFGGVYGQYSTRIVGNILFHSVPYLRNYDPASLEYWEYDKLGTTCSAGCVRLSVADAQWVYNNISSGTIIEFYSDSNPGPLGKPAARKISGNAACRDWDPTDPDPNNPWRNVKPDPTPTPTPTPTPVVTPTIVPTSTPTATPEVSPTLEPTPTNTPDPTITPTPSPTSEPTPTPETEVE